MARRTRITVGISILVFLVGMTAWYFWPHDPEQPSEISGRSATQSELEQLTALIERMDVEQGYARRTGDISNLHTVFVDDAEFPLWGGFQEYWERDLAEVATLAKLSISASDQIGLLSFTAATSLKHHQDGPPYFDGPGKPVIVYDVQISDDVASAKSRLQEGGGTITHYIFRRQDSDWRISAIWTSCPAGCA